MKQRKDGKYEGAVDRNSFNYSTNLFVSVVETGVNLVNTMYIFQKQSESAESTVLKEQKRVTAGTEL